MPEKYTSRRETVLSFSILFLLAVIAVLFFFEQFRFSPAITPPSETLFPVNTKSGSGLIPSAISRFHIPDEMIPLSQIERFEAQNLSDKINGKADFYFQAGFVLLETQRFEINSKIGEWMELFVYTMEKPENAYAVFSSQRRRRSKRSGIVHHAYQTPNALFFAHGPYYVEIILSQESPAHMNVAEAMGRAFVKAIPVQGESVQGDFFFPKTHLQVQSIELIPSNAFGFEKLNHVWRARYRIDADDLDVFVSKRNSIPEAKSLEKAYVEFLNGFGAMEVAGSTEPGIRLFQISEMYEVIVLQDVFLAGVHQGEDKTTALKMALNLKRHLEGIRDGT